MRERAMYLGEMRQANPVQGNSKCKGLEQHGGSEQRVTGLTWTAPWVPSGDWFENRLKGQGKNLADPLTPCT